MRLPSSLDEFDAFDAADIQTQSFLLSDYIYTADKLQRTARWLESMEGGIEKLRKVILDDELGICQALEEAMAQLISTYEDEWARALTFPRDFSVSTAADIRL